MEVSTDTRNLFSVRPVFAVRLAHSWALRYSTAGRTINVRRHSHISMKTKSTNLMQRLIGAVLVCGAAGFWYSASQLPRRQAAPPTPSTMGTLPTVISISSRPAATEFRIAPTGWVVDTADATTRAVIAANEAARRDYGSEPFTEGKSTATFDGRRWSWRQRIGYGRGDLEATVAITPSGTIESATILFTTQQLSQRL